MIIQFLILLAAHWFADFVLQTRWQALNKSENNWALLAHVFNYTVVLTLVTPFLFHPWFVPGVLFILCNFILHFITDWCTSRLNSYLHQRQKTHAFWASIGFDQYIHQVTLALTMLYFFGGH